MKTLIRPTVAECRGCGRMALNRSDNVRPHWCVGCVTPWRVASALSYN